MKKPGIPNVAIILVNWNTWRDTTACVASIVRTDLQGTGVFICDNASTDGSMDRIREWAETRLGGVLPVLERKGSPGSDWPPPNGSVGHLTLIQTGSNLGFAGGSNVGLRYALLDDYDYFWLLNNDTEIDRRTLPALLERMTADPRIGMCGSTLVYAEQPGIVQNLGGGTFSDLTGWSKALGAKRDSRLPVNGPEIERRMRFVSGASMMVSRAFLETVGLLTEDYFLYFEELDWAERSRARFRLGYAPDSVVRHKVGASIGTDDFGRSSLLSTYYLTRSRIRFCWRFHKLALPYVALDLARQVVRSALRGDLSRAKLIVVAALQRPLPFTIGPLNTAKLEKDFFRPKWIGTKL